MANKTADLELIQLLAETESSIRGTSLVTLYLPAGAAL